MLTFGDILVLKQVSLPSRMSLKVFEISEDEMNKIKVGELQFNVFSCYVKEKFAGLVDPRCNWSYGASNILSWR